jgi:hypothetical protein
MFLSRKRTSFNRLEINNIVEKTSGKEPDLLLVVCLRSDDDPIVNVVKPQNVSNHILETSLDPIRP